MKKEFTFALALGCICGMASGCSGDDKEKDPPTVIIENTQELCSDLLDNDGNNLADCKDPNCAAFAFCQETEEGKENTLAACMDEEDNDGDGLVDCDDAECKAFGICQETSAENTLAACQDGKDNDKDGFIDCNDPECKAFNVCNGGSVEEKKTENSPADCMDGEDNDGDGKIDCDDEGCRIFSFCPDKQKEEEILENTEAKCTDGEDNDKNGLLDCLDPNCKEFDICKALTGVAENTRALCSDDIDNDYNGVKDKDDPNCKLFYAAGGKYGENSLELCKDGQDNDGDGVQDCQDPECQVYDICMTGYPKDKPADDKCPDDPFKFKEDKCACGETLVGDDCYINVAKPADFDKMTDSKKKFIIKQNIDFGTTDRAPIMNFLGTLDGNNMRISGVFNQKSKSETPEDSSSYCGLFGRSTLTSGDQPSILKNIDMAITLNCNHQENSQKDLYVGALAGSFRGTSSTLNIVENITGSSKVYVEEKSQSSINMNANVYKFIGGLLGDSRYTKVSNITIMGNVSANLTTKMTNNASYVYRVHIGGVAGRVNSLTNVHANNYVTLKRESTTSRLYDFIGGLSGYVDSDVENVSNVGVIKFLPFSYGSSSLGGGFLGGIAGSSVGNIKHASFGGVVETNTNTPHGGRYVTSSSFKFGFNVGGILGASSPYTDATVDGKGIDNAHVNASFKVVSAGTNIGGIVGSMIKPDQYVRNCTAQVDLELTPEYSESSERAVNYGGIIGLANYNVEDMSDAVYIVNNSARTNHIQTNYQMGEKQIKNINGIAGNKGIVVNNFASDKLTCLESCSYMPGGIGGSYVYESYWDKELFGTESGASLYSDASAEPYTYNIEGIPVTRTAQTVLGLLNYNAGHDGGVLSAHIPSNDDAKYNEWTTENDKDGRLIPVPMTK